MVWFVGPAMFDNHDYKKLVGKIAGSFIKDKRLYIVGNINEKTEHGKKVWEKIQDGEYGGLSLGTFGMKDEKTGKISDRMIAEASPCPFEAPSGMIGDLISKAQEFLNTQYSKSVSDNQSSRVLKGKIIIMRLLMSHVQKN